MLPSQDHDPELTIEAIHQWHDAVCDFRIETELMEAEEESEDDGEVMGHTSTSAMPWGFSKMVSKKPERRRCSKLKSPGESVIETLAGATSKMLGLKRASKVSAIVPGKPVLQKMGSQRMSCAHVEQLWD